MKGNMYNHVNQCSMVLCHRKIKAHTESNLKSRLLQLCREGRKSRNTERYPAEIRKGSFDGSFKSVETLSIDDENGRRVRTGSNFEP